MKKWYNYLGVFALALAITKIDVEAQEYKEKDIPNNSYVIGTHLFTREKNENYDGQLTTKHIMLGASTIESEDIENMIIYYKDPRGDWYDELSEERVEIDDILEIEYVDTYKYIVKPVLKKYQTYSDGKYIFEISTDNHIKWESEEEPKDYIFNYENYELSELKDGEYQIIKEQNIHEPAIIKLEIGEIKTIVARAFELDGDGNKIYSDYSEEMILDGTIDTKTPEIEIKELGYNEIEKSFEYSIVIKNKEVFGDKRDGSNYYTPIITDIELSKKDKEQFETIANIKHVDFNDEALFYIDAGEKVEVAIRLYVLDSDGNPVYSKYSDEYTIDNSSIKLEYTVTFNTDGGSSVVSQNINKGEKVTKPSDPTKPGYIFKEWQLNGSTYNFNSEVTSDITLTAVWEEIPVEYIVTFNTDGGSNVVSQTITKGEKVSVPAIPTKTHYKFKEWQLNGSTYDFNSEVTSDITLTAVWELNNFTIRKEQVDNLSLDVRLVVYEEGEKVSFSSITYNDKNVPTTVNESSIQGITTFVVTLTDGTVVNAIVE